MAMFTKIFATIYLIRTYLTASCNFVSRGSQLVETISAVKVQALKELAAEKRVLESKESQQLDSQIQNVCARIGKGSQLTNSLPSKTFLGQGAFATVVSMPVEYNQPKKAVKILSFESLLREKLEERPSMKPHTIKTVLQRLSALQVLAEKSHQAIQQVTIEDVTELQLQTLIKKALPEPEFKTLYSLLTKEIMSYWQMLFAEVSLNESIQNALDNLPNTVVGYLGCHVDPGLNTYVFMQQLGISLFEARVGCAGPLYHSLFENKIPRYLNMFFTVAMLHDHHVNICDIKLENMMLSLDFDPHKLYFTDFGLSTFKKACQGGTPGYAPPEAFTSNYQKTDFEELTSNDVPIVNQFDAFSLSIIMCGIELELDEFALLYNSRDEQLNSILEQNRIDQTISNEIQKLQNNNPMANLFPFFNKAATDKSNMERLRSQARGTLLKAQDYLRRAKDAIFHSNPLKQAYLRRIQKLINYVVCGLMNANYNERLSVREALYLFYVLSQLVTETTLDFEADTKIARELKRLDSAKILFANAAMLRRAMRGEFKPIINHVPEIMSRHRSKAILKPLKIQPAGMKLPVLPQIDPQNNPDLSNDERDLLNIEELKKGIRLPTYADAVVAIREKLTKKIQKRLI